MKDDGNVTQRDIDKAWNRLPVYIILGILTMPFRWLMARM